MRGYLKTDGGHDANDYPVDTNHAGNEIETNEKGRERHSSPEWQHLCRFVKAIAVRGLRSPLYVCIGTHANAVRSYYYCLL